MVNFLENEPTLVGYENLTLFLRLDFAITSCIFFWFLFCENFAGSPYAFLRNKIIVYITAITGVVLAIVSLFTDLIVRDVSFTDGVIIFVSGPLYSMYVLYVVTICFGGIGLLLAGRHRAQKLNQHDLKRQLNLITLGSILAFGNIIISSTLVRYVGFGSELSRLGIYGLFIFIVLATFLIIRHHYFDFKLAIIRTASFLVVTIGVLFLYVFFAHKGVDAIFKYVSYESHFIVDSILTMFVALTFHPIQVWFGRLTKNIFYKNDYNSEQLLAELTHIMAANINLNVMSQELLRTVKSSLGIGRAAFFLNRSDGTIVTLVDDNDFSFNESLTERLLAQFHECERTPHQVCDGIFQNIHEGGKKQLFRDLRVGAMIHIRTNGATVGTLMLGEKLSGELYTAKDIDFFEIFADEVGIAIHNALVYEEVQKLTATLETRVAERTQQLQNAQAQKLAEAEAVSQLKDEFVFIATHELRSPITAIRVFLEMVESSHETVPPAIHEHLTSMKQASDHLNQLIDDLLEVARSDSNAINVCLGPVDILSIIKEVESELQSLIVEKHVTVTYTNVAFRPFVLGDKSKLLEVVSNLFSNAVKYNKEGGTIDISFLALNDDILVEFRDNGIGIPKEHQENVFDKFFRSSTKQTELVTGTGLGLFIVRMLLGKMGGSIRFSSVEGGGSTFVFSLRGTHTSVI